MRTREVACTAWQGSLLALACWQGCRQLGVTTSRVQWCVGIPAIHVAIAAVTRQSTADLWLLPRDSWRQVAYIGGDAILVLTAVHLSAIPVHRLIKRVYKVGPQQNAILYLKWAMQVGGSVWRRALLETCLFAPVAEELLFRGFIQENVGKLQRVYDPAGYDSLEGKWVRIGICSTLFGLWHYSGRQGLTNLFLVPTTAVGGVLLGLMADAAGLLPAIAVHACQNALVTARLLFLR